MPLFLFYSLCQPGFKVLELFICLGHKQKRNGYTASRFQHYIQYKILYLWKDFPSYHICVLCYYILSHRYLVVPCLLSWSGGRKSQYITNTYDSGSKCLCFFMSPVVSGGCHHHRNPSSCLPAQLLGATQGAETVTHPDWRHYYGKSIKESSTHCTTKWFWHL